MAPSPTVARWELALRLRERRRERGLEVQTVCDQLGFTRNYLSLVENEKTLLAEERLRALAGVLGFDAEETGQLLELRQASRERGWWDAPPLEEPLRRFYGMEAGASRILTYENVLVTGLLQTEDYARALIASDPFVSSVQVDELLAIRLRRQERLVPSGSLALTTVMSEAATLQQIGGPGILADQLHHIVELCEAMPDRIDLRIVPFASTPGGLVGSSTLYFLEYASAYLPTVAWQESIHPIGIIEDADTLRRLSLSYDQALGAALSREESLRLIESTARDLARIA